MVDEGTQHHGLHICRFLAAEVRLPPRWLPDSSLRDWHESERIRVFVHGTAVLSHHKSVHSQVVQMSPVVQFLAVPVGRGTPGFGGGEVQVHLSQVRVVVGTLHVLLRLGRHLGRSDGRKKGPFEREISISYCDMSCWIGELRRTSFHRL
jgi:hypothetical protein